LTVDVGIGLAIAEYLLKTSNNIVVIARSQDALEELRQRDPEHVRVLAGDLSDLSLAQKGVDLAAKEFGKLDGLIVNHGIIDPVTKLRDTNAEEWKKTFDVNFISAVALVGSDRNVVLPSLRKSRPRRHCLS
jgi:NAD(P)-dependent dehydrogenase (short-subunit alcohol dehydrogenase family)